LNSWREPLKTAFPPHDEGMTMRALSIRVPVALGLLLCPLLSLAQGAAAAPVADTGDTAWIIAATALVLFMTLPGLALFYAGLVRAKNVLSILMQCFAVTGVVSLVWLAVGYSLTFSDGGAAQAFIGGLDKTFLRGVTRDALSGTIPETLFFMFQMTFAIITPALVIGGFAERMRFSAVLGFTILWLLLVYVPLAHWVWGGGWLAKLGVMDFAGGIVVHVSAGVAALVCALVLGRRRGFPQTSMAPHSLPLTVAGAGMLWVGWFGFNAGSALAANGSAGMAMLTTHMGASAGALAWMFIEWKKYGKPSMLGVVTGMVAGLGTITPASGFVGPLGAVCIGMVAGTVCFFATQLLKRKLQIDDSLDVSPVHGIGGIIGTLMTGVFAATWLGGVGFTVQTSVGAQLGVQALGVLSAAAWCALATWLILKLLDVVVGLRVAEEQETEGLDLAEHGERGYSP
jgi:Amt family ammonium transporter